MDIIFISNSGEALPLVLRLRREGVDAGIYIHHSQYKNNYNGILHKLSVKGLKKQLTKTDTVVFDISRPNERTKFDIILLKTFGLKSSLPSVFGPIADKLKKDHIVIGASALTEQLELDRHKGIELADKVGFAIPEYQRFGNLREGIKFLRDNKELWVFKPDDNQSFTYVEKFAGDLLAKMSSGKIPNGKYILQRFIKGAEVSSEVWIGEKGPVHYNRTIEAKNLLTGNLGPQTGSQVNLVWAEKSTEAVAIPELTKMAEIIHSWGYRGPCDVNCIISGKTPYFLEWTPRFGWDAFYCLTTLMKGSLSEFFKNDFAMNFHDGYAASVRLSVPPYPYSNPSLRSELAKDMIIDGSLDKMPAFWGQDIYLDDGKLKIAGADGIIGVVSARADKVEPAWSKVYSLVNKMKVGADLQYRTDGFSETRKRLEKLKVA